MKFLLFACCLLAGTVSAQNPQDCFGEGPFIAGDTQGVLQGAEKFGINLFKNIAFNFSRDSFIMSPYSIFSVMKISYYGSTGITEQQLQKGLNMPSKMDTYWVSNRIEAARALSTSVDIKELNKAYFSPDVQLRSCAFGKVLGLETVDFSNGNLAAKKINSDIEQATNGEIRNFLTPPLVENAKSVLVNAIYFKGKWENQFDKAKTLDSPFFDEKGVELPQQARMMEAKAKFGYVNDATLGAEVVELPYENSNISMLILLPNSGSTVNKILGSLNELQLQRTVEGMRHSSIVTVNLPAFNFTTKLSEVIKNSIMQTGITQLFTPSPDNLANFAPQETQFMVEKILHQATIRVDEEGTVASAATGLVITRTGIEKNIVFTANRPFVFIIRDQVLGTSYFIGVYRNPKDSKPQ